MSHATPPATIRPAALGDCLPVCRLLGGLGLGVSPDEGESLAAWRHTWVDNPARGAGEGPFSPGWVLEAEGRTVGFFGSIPMRYRMGGRDLRVAVASQWGVEKPFRGHTPELARAYFEQPGADLLLVTTAIRPTARIFERHGGVPLPLPEYSRVLFWVLDAPRFLSAALRKKGVPAAAAAAAGLALAPLAAVERRVRGRRPGRRSGAVRVEPVALESVGAEVDELFARVTTADPRLYAWRAAADLRWHFGPTAAAGDLTLLFCRRGERLAGYLALKRERNAAVGLTRARVVDLLVEGEDPEVAGALLAAAADAARGQGCSALEVVGLPPGLRARVEAFRPLSRELPTFPVYWRAAEAGTAAALGDPAAWYPTPYDGDAAF